MTDFRFKGFTKVVLALGLLTATSLSTGCLDTKSSKGKENSSVSAFEGAIIAGGIYGIQFLAENIAGTAIGNLPIFGDSTVTLSEESYAKIEDIVGYAFAKNQMVLKTAALKNLNKDMNRSAFKDNWQSDALALVGYFYKGGMHASRPYQASISLYINSSIKEWRRGNLKVATFKQDLMNFHKILGNYRALFSKYADTQYKMVIDRKNGGVDGKGPRSSYALSGKIYTIDGKDTGYIYEQGYTTLDKVIEGKPAFEKIVEAARHKMVAKFMVDNKLRILGPSIETYRSGLLKIANNPKFVKK